MASGKKQTQALARELFKLSFAHGTLSADQVAGVLAYVENSRPANPTSLLKAYQRLIAAEVARGQAIVEHAGAVGDSTLAAISSAMTAKYGRPIATLNRRNDGLIAGLRIRVGDDLYESSVSSQLAALGAAL
jgi:F-type H+-transporting ATPase subunit delta